MRNILRQENLNWHCSTSFQKMRISKQKLFQRPLLVGVFERFCDVEGDMVRFPFLQMKNNSHTPTYVITY
jgi:hypothetical protein